MNQILLNDRQILRHGELFTSYCIFVLLMQSMLSFLLLFFMNYLLWFPPTFSLIAQENNQNDGWSTEDKEQLLKLIDEYGTNWAPIGRILGRHYGDCQTAYGRMQVQPNQGRFTIEEDIALVAAVRRLLDISSDVPLQDMPSEGIWTLILFLFVLRFFTADFFCTFYYWSVLFCLLKLYRGRQ